jgi:hypothetical protein
MRTKVTDKELDKILSKMFDIVGVKFQSIKESCKGKKWFMKYTWTREQEQLFEKWLKKFLMEKLRMPAKIAIEYVKWFTFDYGWKYSEKQKDEGGE